MNHQLISSSLEKVWINGIPDSNGDVVTSELDREESATSSVSLGDTHIWRDNGETIV
jgi:hypothetical protein